jgi:GNAT superfamily N-acetyltransferase
MDSKVQAAYISGYASHAANYLRKHGNTGRHVRAWAEESGLRPHELKQAVRALARCKAAADLFSSKNRDDFTYEVFSDGAVLYYKGREIGGRTKVHPGVDLSQWAEALIDDLVQGYGAERILNLIAEIDSIKVSSWDDEQQLLQKTFGKGPQNRGVWKGQRFWSGVANVEDGTIIEVHTYEEAEQMDFNDFYVSEESKELMNAGKYTFFWVNYDTGEVLTQYEPQDAIYLTEQERDKDDVKARTVRRIARQIAIIPKDQQQTHLFGAKAKACECGHPMDIHSHPPDFGCPHEKDGCGCRGATEKTSTQHPRSEHLRSEVFRAMALCSQCKACLRHAAFFRLVDHLENGHEWEEASAIANEAFRRLAEHRKQPVMAGAAGVKQDDTFGFDMDEDESHMYKNTPLQDLFELYIPPGLQGDLESAPSEPFMGGKYTLRKAKRCYVVFDGEQPIAQFKPGWLYVEEQYRNKGIGSALTKEFLKDFPAYRPPALSDMGKHIPQLRQQYRKTHKRTAGMWGDRSYDNDAVHDILDRHRTPFFGELDRGFEESIAPEEVEALLAEMDALGKTARTSDDLERYFGTMVFLVTHGVKLDAAHKNTALDIGGELLQRREYRERWKNPLVRKHQLQKEIQLFGKLSF